MQCSLCAQTDYIRHALEKKNSYYQGLGLKLGAACHPQVLTNSSFFPWWTFSLIDAGISTACVVFFSFMKVTFPVLLLWQSKLHLLP